MKMKVTALIAAALCGSGLIAACGSEASSPDNGSGSGAIAAECMSSMQIFPTIAGCDATTRMCGGATVPPDDQACTECLDEAAALGQQINELTTCACNRCAIFLAACFQSAEREPNGDATRDAQCQAVVECAQASGCAGVQCYCGTAALDVCLMGMGNGPCVQQIATAAGCPATDAQCILMAQMNTDSALGRASAVGTCTLGDPLQMIAGNCMATTTAP